MKKGRSLERLIAHLERLQASDNCVVVTSPARLRDKSNGQLREHDVILEITFAHHKQIVAFECRDRSRPVGSGDVEAFYTKCQHTGVDKGILVSTKAFSKPAVTKAALLNIECFELEEVETFSAHRIIMLCRSVDFYSTTILNFRWTVISDDPISLEHRIWEYKAPDGSPIDVGLMNRNAKLAFDALPAEPPSVGQFEKHLRFDGEGCFAIDRESNERLPVKTFIATVTYEVRLTQLPLQSFKYKKTDNETEIANFSRARGSVEGKELDFVLSVDENGLSISFIPNDEKPKAD